MGLPAQVRGDPRAHDGGVSMTDRETMIARASFAAGWDAALDETRAAIASMFRNGRPIGGPIEDLNEILEVIDVLREKP